MDTQGPAADHLPGPERGARCRRGLRRLAREPFLHFLALGLLIVLVRSGSGGTPERYRVTVGPADVRRLATGYEWQFGRPPTAGELDHLVDRHIEEEILYREGVALGLDRDDEIVRRRVVQKLQFLQEDTALVPEPDEAALHAFRARNADRYRESARATFRHVYFSPDAGGHQAARARAVGAIATTRAAGPASAGGDPFPGRDRYADLDADGLARIFGDSELSRALLALAPGTWHGPLQSGYGWHLVFVEALEPAREPPFADVRERVRADYVDTQRQAANAAALAAIKARYVVVRRDLEE